MMSQKIHGNLKITLLILRRCSLSIRVILVWFDLFSFSFTCNTWVFAARDTFGATLESAQKITGCGDNIRPPCTLGIVGTLSGSKFQLMVSHRGL